MGEGVVVGRGVRVGFGVGVRVGRGVAVGSGVLEGGTVAVIRVGRAAVRLASSVSLAHSVPTVRVGILRGNLSARNNDGIGRRCVRRTE